MPDQQTLLLSAALILAAALAAYHFLREPDALEESPRPGSAMEKFGPDVRLRDLFRLAVLLEEEGMALYLKLAEQSLNPETRRLCARLADDEAEHKQLFQDRLSRWRSLYPNRLTWPTFLERVKQEGLYGNPPDGKANEQEMAAYAIRQEKNTVEFYRMFENSFPDAWRREKLKDLVEQERSHEQKLREAYPDIP
jgi:rubrerythrin